MSWWGSHSKFTKEQASAILPKGHCKHCNYWVRFIMECDSLKYMTVINECSRCGITYKTLDILYKARQLGFIPKEKQIDG